MENKDITTEEKILQAAETVFIEKGMDGARMQEIADKAGINKALLHYYYRSKEKLFEMVFEMAIKLLFPEILKIINKDIPLFEKIKLFTSSYIDFILKHPHIPTFILHELNNHPDHLAKHLSKLNLKNSHIVGQIQQEVKSGLIRPITAEHLMINIVSMCVFPIIATPILKPIFFNNDKTEFANFIEERKTLVADFVINSIRI